MRQAAIFLDRDGVINENRVDHVQSWSEFRFIPGTLPALRLLARSKLPIVAVTNQAIVGRNILQLDALDRIHENMRRRIMQFQGRIDEVYICPHRPEDGCGCRKPEPGLFFRAADELHISLEQSVFVGDAVTDLIAGKRAGCATVLVRSGRGDAALGELRNSPFLKPDAVASDLFEAVPILFDLLALRAGASAVDSSTAIVA